MTIPEMAIGNIESQKKGSGARANNGKPDWSLMPLTQVSWLMSRIAGSEKTVYLTQLPALLGQFQEQGTRQCAFDILEYGVRYFMVDSAINFQQVMESVIKVWHSGAEKYTAFNWMKGMPWSVPLACAQRHVMAIFRDEELDPESGEHHMAHFICNAMMLVHYTHYYQEGNDLPVQWFK